MPIQLSLTPQASEELASVGRSEDLAFSTGGGRLAIASFYRGVIVVFGVEIRTGEDGAPVLHLDHHVNVACDALAAPHAVDFLGDDRLVVANRHGATVVLPVPPRPAGTDPLVRVEPLALLDAHAGRLALPLREPNSLAVRRTDGLWDVLLCSLWHSTTARFVIDDDSQVLAAELLLDAGIHMPDGVAFSSDGRWIAVSNHEQQHVSVYAVDPTLGPDTAPVGHLHGVGYPHGLTFADGDRAVIVADAGAPTLHCFRSDDGWRGDHHPIRRVEAFDDETFQKGRYNETEGGPKGVSVHPSGALLATTNEHATLVVWEVEELVGPLGAGAATRADGDAADADTSLLRWVMARLDATHVRIAAERAAHEAQITDVRRRVAALVRGNDVLRRAAQRGRTEGEGPVAERSEIPVPHGRP